MQATKGCPSFHFGFFAADFTAATAVRMLDAMPERTSFVAPQRGNPRWRIIPPAEIEVYVEEKNGDVCLRDARITRISRFVCTRVGDPARLSSFSIRSGAPHAAVALRPGDCATPLVDGDIRRAWGRGITPASRAIWFWRSSVSARKRTGRAMSTFVPPNRRSAQRSGRPRQGHEAGLHRSRKLSFPRDFPSLADQGRRTGGDVKCCLIRTTFFGGRQSEGSRSGRRSFELRTQIVPRS